MELIGNLFLIDQDILLGVINRLTKVSLPISITEALF